VAYSIYGFKFVACSIYGFKCTMTRCWEGDRKRKEEKWGRKKHKCINFNRIFPN